MAETLLSDAQRLFDNIGNVTRQIAVQESSLQARAAELDRREQAVAKREAEIDSRSVVLNRTEKEKEIEKAIITSPLALGIQDIPSPSRSGLPSARAGRPPRTPDSSARYASPKSASAASFFLEGSKPVGDESTVFDQQGGNHEADFSTTSVSAVLKTMPATWSEPLPVAAPVVKEMPANDTAWNPAAIGRPTTAADWGMAVPVRITSSLSSTNIGEVEGQSLGGAATLRDMFEQKFKQQTADASKQTRRSQPPAGTSVTGGNAGCRSPVTRSVEQGAQVASNPSAAPSASASRAAEELAAIRAARAAAREENNAPPAAAVGTGRQSPKGTVAKGPTLKELLQQDEEKMNTSRGSRGD